MIYLLQDCYKDDKGEYHDILKIGYSKDNFSKNRQGQYNTHNFGYKFLGEREGSSDLENYLHRLFKEYNLDREWFTYSQDIIDKFWKVKEDISEFTSQDELNEYIRYYILKHLVPSVDKLKELYLDQILSEISEKDTEYEENKNIYKRNIIGVFEFVSTEEYKYFSNLNFNSNKIIEKLEDCNLILPQIVGRQRNKSNPFKNNIVIFYKTIQGENIENSLEFINQQTQRKQQSLAILDIFNRCKTDLERTSFLQKINSDIKLSNYSNDFISISKKTGEPVYNSFIEIANERAWEVAQVDYQDKINVTRSISKEGYISSEYYDEEDKIVNDFLGNKFYSSNIFEEKMKLYCEFMDKYSNNKYIFDSIIHKVDPKFKTYYDLYGTLGCKSLSYHEIYLKNKLNDSIKFDDLKSKLVIQFKVGSKYTLKNIKFILKNIYTNLGITKTPKASELENYFDLKLILVQDSSSGKRSKGYLILGIK